MLIIISLFVYNRDEILIWIVIYADDLIITSNTSDEVKSFIKNLRDDFKCKDLEI